MTTKVVVLGSNFGGLVAALDAKHELKDEADVTVISPASRFVFTPSLIWAPFGKRTVKKISFPVEPTFNEHGVHFIHAAATGYRNDLDLVPGVGKPGGDAVTISNPMKAEHAAEKWKQFLEKLGPIVVSGMKHGEGLLKTFLKRLSIDHETNVEMEAVDNGAVVTKTGFPTEIQAHTAAKNVASLVKGEPLEAHEEFGEIPAVCVMDAGNNGVLILADHLFEPRKHELMIPGPQAHGMKLGFEKYFLWKAKTGHVRLP